MSKKYLKLSNGDVLYAKPVFVGAISPNSGEPIVSLYSGEPIVSFTVSFEAGGSQVIKSNYNFPNNDILNNYLQKLAKLGYTNLDSGYGYNQALSHYNNDMALEMQEEIQKWILED